MAVAGVKAGDFGVGFHASIERSMDVVFSGGCLGDVSFPQATVFLSSPGWCTTIEGKGYPKPSWDKLCDEALGHGKDDPSILKSTLRIAIHCTRVINSQHPQRW